MDTTRRPARRAAVLTMAAAAMTAGVAAISAGPASAAPADTMSLVDDTGLLTVDVPIGWVDVTTSPATGADGGTLPQIVAAPDQALFYDTFDTPGVIYTARAFDPDTAKAVTATYDFTGLCQDAGVSPYSDEYFAGSMQSWTSCGGGSATIVTLFVNPPDSAFSATLLIQVPTETDEAALVTILTSFFVVNPSGGAPAPTAAPGAVPFPTISPDPSSPGTSPPVAPTVPGPAAPGSTGGSYDVVDDTGTLTVAVPTAWTGTITTPVFDELGNELPAIVAAPDLQQYAAGTGVGMYLLAEPYTADLAAVIARLAPACTGGTVAPYDDGVFAGFIQEFADCNGSRQITLAVNPIGGTSHTISGNITVDPTDTATVDLILATFNFAEPAARPS